jgi:hypothetical protein
LKFITPLKDFLKEFNKENTQLQVILVNCDNREKEYIEHIKEIPWILAIPFGDEEVTDRLEDLAEAETVPKLSIINLQKSSSELAIKDAKRIILKKTNMTEACEDLR